MIVWGPRMIQYIPNLVAQKAKSALKHADKALKSVFSLWKPQVEVLATLLLTLYKSLEAEQEQEQGVDSGLDQLLATTVGSLEEKIANAASGKKIFASLVPKVSTVAVRRHSPGTHRLSLSVQLEAVELFEMCVCVYLSVSSRFLAQLLVYD